MTAADRPSEPSGQPCNGRSQCSRSADGTKTPSPSIPGSSWAGWHKRAIICDGAGSVASPLLASPADGGVPRPSPVHCVIVSWANATVGLDARRRQGLATRAQMSPGLGIVRLSIFSIKTSQKLFNIPGFVLEAAIEKEKKKGSADLRRICWSARCSEARGGCHTRKPTDVVFQASEERSPWKVPGLDGEHPSFVVHLHERGTMTVQVTRTRARRVAFPASMSCFPHSPLLTASFALPVWDAEYKFNDVAGRSGAWSLRGQQYFVRNSTAHV